MVKNDGSVLVHSDGGSYEPLNWMSPPCKVSEGKNDDGVTEWTVVGQGRRHPADPARGGAADSPMSSASTRGCRRTVWRSTSRSCSPSTPTLADGLTLVRREYPTAIGPVDLMCRDAQGASWPWRSSAAARSTGSSS